MKNEFKDIPNFEGMYQIDKNGNVKSLYNYRKGNILKPRLKKGYYQIGLRKNGIRKWYAIHRLIALTFIPNPNNYKCVNHKDENKLNNNVNNLEWCTSKYNNEYGTRIERVKMKTSKPVLQYDLKGNFIREYKSVREATKLNNIKSISNISLCCKGKYKQVKGYVWKFKKVVV